MRAADLVRSARDRQEITRAALARRAGVDEALVADVEEGSVEPEKAVLEVLLLVMGEEPVDEDGVLVRARRIPDDWDPRHVAVSLQMTPSQRLAQALAWNRFAAEFAIVGPKAVREREEAR